jgi:hypothetical protein
MGVMGAMVVGAVFRVPTMHGGGMLIDAPTGYMRRAVVQITWMFILMLVHVSSFTILSYLVALFTGRISIR